MTIGENVLVFVQSNAKFAMSLEPQNQALVSKFEEVAELRRKGIPTVNDFSFYYKLLRHDC
jgi:hypothetical protein